MGLRESGEIGFEDAATSQLDVAESPASDRVAFDFSPTGNRTAHVSSGEKPGQKLRSCQAVLSLQSGLSGRIEKCGHCSRILEQTSGTSLQSRLRGGEAWIRTRSTVSNPATPDVCVTCRSAALNGRVNNQCWPLGRLRMVHLFVRSFGRTAYDSVAESGQPFAPRLRRRKLASMTARSGAQSRLRSLSAQRAAKRQINRDSQRFLPVPFGELPRFWQERMRFHLCDPLRAVRRG
jgi:hypothetical protein